MQEENVGMDLISQLSQLSDEQKEAIVNHLQELAAGQTGSAEIEDQYLTLWCREQLFAIGISQVIQIVQMEEITPLPEFPAYMRGVISLRGEILPVMDLRLRLGAESAEDDARTCIIIIRINDSSFGLVVDGVNDVTTIGKDEICPPPGNGGQNTGYLSGIAQREKVVLILDMDHLLNKNEIGTILNASADLC